MTTTTTTGGGGGGGKSGTTAAAATTTASQECCMCGDFGLSHELFNCKVCLFRSQHRYCSNLYPKAESYQVCNWCLSQRDDRTEKTNSSNSTSSGRNNSSEDDQLIINNNKIKIKIKKNNSGSDHHNNHGGLKAHQYHHHHHHKGTSQFQSSGPIKKQRSPERSPLVAAAAAAAARKRVISGGGGGVEERLRRTKSEEMSNGGISKQVFRNKLGWYPTAISLLQSLRPLTNRVASVYSKVQGHPWPPSFVNGDHNSFVYSVCFTATASISSHFTKPPFTSIIKPFVEPLFTNKITIVRSEPRCALRRRSM